MNDRLLSLLAALRDVRLDLTGEDVADTLWLAPHLVGAGVIAAAPRDRPVDQSDRGRSTHPAIRPEPPAAEPAAPPPAPLDPGASRSPGDGRGALYLPATGSAVSGGGRPVQIPTGSPLPGSLALLRSLRPLRRRIASRMRLALDLEQTVRRIAEDGLWVPALRPARERWLDLSLVVDGGASMGLWRPLARELYRVFASTGAFRTVRLWGLSTDSTPLRLYCGLTRRPGLAAHDPRELVDPTGRSLVLVLTDCISKAWHEGGAGRVLETWSARGPTALIQVLPEHLWSRTALGLATPVRLTPAGPAAPNARLTARPANPWDDVPAMRPGAPVAVASLEPGPLGAWAALVAGMGTLAAGFVFDLEPPSPPPPRRVIVTPHARLSQFWRVASPTARRLAGLLAAAPAITLPIARLVREALVPEARQVHEAEVLLGGLLKVAASPSHGASDPDPDEVRYDFHDGLRPLLLDAVPTADAREVLERVSAYVAEHLGQGRDFRAVLADPTASGAAIEPDPSPFARVAAEVMLRLGGDHARLVWRGSPLRRATGSGAPGPPIAGKVSPPTRPVGAQVAPPLRRAAGAESLKPTLGRVRPPRVHITYDVESGGASARVELPFVVGVLADLSGQPLSPPRPLSERNAVSIDRDNFDAVLERMGPRVACKVQNRLTDEDTRLAIELRFRSMDDFSPESVVMMVPALRKLLEARQRLVDLLNKLVSNDRLEATLSRVLVDERQISALAEQLRRASPREGMGPDPSTPPEPQGQAGASLLDQIIESARPRGREDAGSIRDALAALVSHVQPVRDDRDLEAQLGERIAGIDRVISAQLDEILHDGGFQRLEATWRGLRYLVHETETSEELKIRVLDVSKLELFKDQDRAIEFDQSQLFKKIYEEEYGQLGGQPYGLLVGDYEFGRNAQDVTLLKMISNVAAMAHAPFVSNASPKLFNFESFTELANPRDLAKIFEGVEYTPWRAFRESEDSRYVALTLPRVLGRLPYGQDFKPVAAFNYEERVDGREHNNFLWMGAAWAYAARITDAFGQWGWMARTRGVEGGGKVEGLPVHTFPTDEGDVAMKCPTEIGISDRREFELSKLGFLPLGHNKWTDFAIFMGAQSCQKPKTYFSSDANANAELLANFDILLCTSRIVHYLKVMARDKMGLFMEAGDCANWLNDWIQNYVVRNPELVGDEVKAKKPLAEARIDVRPVAGKPGYYEAVAYLRPHYQFEALKSSMRLVFEIPKKVW
jgi:type VI secretion system protein ImpC